MRDTNLALKATGAESASTTGTGVDFGAADVHPFTYVIDVTAEAGTTKSFAIVIQESSDDSTYTNFLQFDAITTTGVYRMTGKSDKRYRRYKSTLTGTTSLTYSIYAELGGEYTSF